jgi:hypothetical protein
MLIGSARLVPRLGLTWTYAYSRRRGLHVGWVGGYWVDHFVEAGRTGIVCVVRGDSIRQHRKRC